MKEKILRRSTFLMWIKKVWRRIKLKAAHHYYFGKFNFDFPETLTLYEMKGK